VWLSIEEGKELHREMNRQEFTLADPKQDIAETLQNTCKIQSK